ncbi:DUF427 domain-containing protein [Nakamurella sp. YIM 132087]|uniref:DUF427 domain-containing protein n=1 Tax=Nakamurella alba TaxID=2665158 RepID=A0A7K1FTI1_9ACTN|nr:DUF427 domain-containing protein [Nakamurella alba]MTD16104.1 DUF427 domain-containing protein [Nakamurella alba]
MRPRPLPAGPGQESVWDYPRPPRIDPSPLEVTVRAGGKELARTSAAVRVLETSHPPNWYLPADAVAPRALTRSAVRGTVCEWKGLATYWDVRIPDGVLEAAAWSYEDPTPGFRSIAGMVSWYPALVECTVGGERVQPQDGGFYGGWITADVVGPFKGSPGSFGW